MGGRCKFTGNEAPSEELHYWQQILDHKQEKETKRHTEKTRK